MRPESPGKYTEEKDHVFMRMALEEAEKAALQGEVPVGAVVVRQGQVIARAHNLRETTETPLPMPSCWPLTLPVRKREDGA